VAGYAAERSEVDMGRGELGLQSSSVALTHTR
jgi:hypothetical protein